MLRQFSEKRIISFFILDWLGTLAMLLCAAVVHVTLGQFPGFVVDFVQDTEIRLSGIGVGPGISSTNLPLPVLAAVLIIWPLFLFIFSVYNGSHNGTIWQELKNVFFAICLSMVALAGFLFLTYPNTSGVFS